MASIPLEGRSSFQPADAASGPDGRWMRDLTFVATAGGGSKCYIHVETRRVAWQGSTRTESRLVTSTGALVDQVADGVYRVRATGMVLRLAQPNDPTGKASGRPAGPDLSRTPLPMRGLTSLGVGQPVGTSFRVLVVDDDPGQARSTVAVLQSNGFEVLAAASVAEAKAAGFSPHVVVADLSLPGQGGMELFNWARSLPVPAAVVVVTGFTVTQRLLAAERAGAAVVLLKPVTPKDLVDHVRRACPALPRV